MNLKEVVMTAAKELGLPEEYIKECLAEGEALFPGGIGIGNAKRGS